MLDVGVAGPTDRPCTSLFEEKEQVVRGQPEADGPCRHRDHDPWVRQLEGERNGQVEWKRSGTTIRRRRV